MDIGSDEKMMKCFWKHTVIKDELPSACYQFCRVTPSNPVLFTRFGLMKFPVVCVFSKTGENGSITTAVTLLSSENLDENMANDKC